MVSAITITFLWSTVCICHRCTIMGLWPELQQRAHKQCYELDHSKDTEKDITILHCYIAIGASFRAYENNDTIRDAWSSADIFNGSGLL